MVHIEGDSGEWLRSKRYQCWPDVDFFSDVGWCSVHSHRVGGWQAKGVYLHG